MKTWPDAGGTGFIARGGEDLVDQLRVPRAGEAERLREAGAAVFHESVQRLAHKQLGNAEPRLLFQIALHAVAQNGRFAGREDEIGVPPAIQTALRRLDRCRCRWDR